MADFLKPKKTNPRGIPEAPFIEKVDSIIKNPDKEFEITLKAFQDRLQQYKYMELSKQQQLADLRVKIPDIEKNLSIINHIQERKRGNDDGDNDDGDDEYSKTLECNYELDSTLYSRAKIDLETLDSVCLWLGADVMLEFPLNEAVELLNKRLENNNESLRIVEEDLDFLRQNITTMEVNTARLYNWDVERRKKLRGQDASKT